MKEKERKGKEKRKKILKIKFENSRECSYVVLFSYGGGGESFTSSSSEH